RGVVYLNDWAGYLGGDGASAPREGEGKWKVGKGRAGPVVSMAFHEALPPIRIPVQANGEYDIYFGVVSGPVRFLARAGDGPWCRVVTSHLSAGYHAGKTDQEIYWTRSRLQGGQFEIAQLRETAVAHFDFGRLS